MYWSLLVAKEIFEPTQRLSKCLQATSMTVTGAIEAVKIVHSLLVTIRSDEKFDYIMKKVDEAQIKYNLELLAVPRLRRPLARYDDGAKPVELTVKTYYRQQFFEVLDKALTCLKDRFIENSDLHLFAEVEDILIQASPGPSASEEGTNRIS